MTRSRVPVPGLSRTDERLCARFADGEMTAAERAEFERRLANEDQGALALAVWRVEAGSRALRDLESEPLRAPAGFSAAVIERVRAMPSRQELIQNTIDEETVVGLVVYGRRLLVAAAVLFAFSMLFSFQMFKNVGGKDLHADELTKQMRELDQKVLQLRRQEGPIRKG